MLTLKQIGRNARRAREAAHLRQRDVARTAGVSEDTVRSLERADHAVSIEAFVAYADAVGVEPGDLLTTPTRAKLGYLFQAAADAYETLDHVATFGDAVFELLRAIPHFHRTTPSILRTPTEAEWLTGAAHLRRRIAVIREAEDG